MKQQLQKAVTDLHRNGYTQDFVIYGNELFWSQEKTILREQEFLVERYYRIYSPDGKADYLVLGILAIDKAAKGILLTSYSYGDKRPGLIFKKLKAFAARAIKSYTQ